jgi:glycosyltransferase involved in cell wall biosynthesis
VTPSEPVPFNAGHDRPAAGLSVALGTYNGERYLVPLLESIARQTLPPHELVVSDDASDDNTVELVREFAADAPFVVRVTVNAARLGFGDNYLRAAERCEGDLIAFCDQDDIWHQDKLRRCVAAFGDSRVGLVVHRGDVVDEALRPTGQKHPSIRRTRTAPPHACDPLASVPGFAMVFRRHLLHADIAGSRPRSRWSERPMHHDEWIWFWARLCGHTCFIPDSLVLYRQHADNSAGAPDARFARLFDVSLSARDATYRGFSELTESYAVFLRRAAEALPEQRGDVLRGADTYASIARNARLRSALYEPEAAVPDRLARLMRLISSAAYRSPAKGGLGSRSMLKDATLGLLRPVSRA